MCAYQIVYWMWGKLPHLATPLYCMLLAKGQMGIWSHLINKSAPDQEDLINICKLQGENIQSLIRVSFAHSIRSLRGWEEKQLISYNYWVKSLPRLSPRGGTWGNTLTGALCSQIMVCLLHKTWKSFFAIHICEARGGIGKGTYSVQVLFRENSI